jgi:hypothetical protein
MTKRSDDRDEDSRASAHRKELTVLTAYAMLAAALLMLVLSIPAAATGVRAVGAGPIAVPSVGTGEAPSE